MARIFKTPFGAQGDTEQVPEAPQGDGSVSLTQGFGYDYEREYEDPAAKDIRREIMNGILHDITEAIGDIQLTGIAKWSADAAPYPAGAVVWHDSVAWMSTAGNNSSVPGAGADWTELAGDAADVLRQELADPTQGGELVKVTTSTGEQTLAEALDKRIINIGTVSDLKALDPSKLHLGQAFATDGYYSPGDGGGNEYVIVEGATSLDDGGSFIDIGDGSMQAKGLFRTKVSARQFGAVGDGVADDFLAIKNAVAFGSGRIIEIESGHYFAPYRSPLEGENWIDITSSGTKIKASGEVVVENMLWFAGGAPESPVSVGTAGFSTGADILNTAQPHDLGVGDYIQVLSQINANTTDAGEWQLASQNPTTLLQRYNRFSEIHKVSEVISETEFRIYGSITYPNYRDNTSGQSFPMPGVTSAEIRKLNPLTDIEMEGIEFRNTTNNNFRTILFKNCAHIRIRNCKFTADTLPGTHLVCESVHDFIMEDCYSHRNPQNVTGSSWNSFLFQGGSQYIKVRSCHFTGEGQTFDFTHPLIGNIRGDTSEDVKTDSLTVQFMDVSHNSFTRCDNAFTTHPGTYHLVAIGNNIEAIDTGILIRSLSNIVKGNSIFCESTGLTFGGFTSDSLVQGNTIVDQNVGKTFVGINVVPMSSDTMSNNNARRFRILDNSIIQNGSVIGSSGIQLRHTGNGVAPNPEFTGWTDAIKTAQSDYLVRGNTFNGCRMLVGSYINRAVIEGNNFRRGAIGGYYIQINPNAAAAVVYSNTFMDTVVDAVSSANSPDPAFSYDVRTIMGQNYGTVSSPVYSLGDNRPLPSA